jgi:hypothetical protein
MPCIKIVDPVNILLRDGVLTLRGRMPGVRSLFRLQLAMTLRRDVRMSGLALFSAKSSNARKCLPSKAVRLFNNPVTSGFESVIAVV